MKKNIVLMTFVSILFTLFAANCVFAQFAGGGPKPGDIYKEFTFNHNTDNWRVTDPDADPICDPGNCPSDYLPNPVLEISIDDLAGAVKAEIVIDFWGGHEGTIDKKFRFNGNTWITIPELDELGTAPPPGENYMQQVNHLIEVSLDHLQIGTNTLEGICGPNDWDWGQWGWYGVVLRVYYDSSKPHATGQITSHSSNSLFSDNPTITAVTSGNVSRVDFLAYYEGYDTDGDGVFTDWHRNYHRESWGSPITIRNHVGTATGTPHEVTWDTQWLPDQALGQIKLIARIRDSNGYWYVTDEVSNLTLQRTYFSVKLYKPTEVPQVFWVRAGQVKSSIVNIPSLSDATEAVMHVATWNGDDGTELFSSRVNDWVTPEYGSNHFHSYDQIPMPISALITGDNTITFSSATTHHGIEIMWPGPAVMVRYDLSAGGAPIIISQPSDQNVIIGQTATFSIEALGATPLTYQWRKNGIDISGATDPSYTTPTVVLSDDGSVFSCMVSNLEGDVMSNDAVLHVADTSTAMSEDFETYAAGSDPVDWFDTAADNSMEEDDSLFKVFDLSGNKAFGTTSTLTNIHSHYMGTGSDALSSYEYTGRMSMTLAGSGIGVTFLSQYPQQDAYYRLRRYTDNSFHISPHGTSITGGTTDTGVVPLPNVWYRFRIQVVDTGTRTEIKARVWQDGTAEPSVWQVDAYDDSATRLTSGTIGVWGFTSGSKYWDDLVVDSWSPPAEQYQLTASVTGGNGTVSPLSGNYYEGAVVTLTALPDPGYRVLAWSGTDNDALTTNTNTVTMDADKTVTVEFELIPVQYNLTASVTGGNGTVSPTSGAYDEGAVVTLTALPDPGYRVLAWSGTDNDALTTNTNTVTMIADKTVTVEFELIQYALTASVTGGNGTVSPTSGAYDEGAVVTLTALPDPGYRVLAWSGTDNDALTTNTNTVTMDADKTVTVEFELIPVQYNLTASVTGGNGTVSPTSGAYDEGAVVTLTALPDPGYRVLAWSGTDNDALTTNTNTVTMIADKTVTVEFELIQYALTASVTGGNGTVSPTSGAYDEGAVVTLTALPDPGYRVLAWSGTDNDALTTNTNTVTMDADKTVTVEFELIPVQYNLTASVTGGNGTVSPTSGAYDEGAVVTLTALPDPGYRVLAWSGTDNDALTTNTNTVTMIADKTVTVTFLLDNSIVSDDFNACTLDPMWTLVDPLGDATVLMQGAGTGDAQLLLSVPAGASHDAWNLNTAPVLLQPANNEDFTVQVKFDSPVEEGFQSQGIIIQEDSNNWLRFDFYSNGEEMRIFAAITVNGSSSPMLEQSITPGAPIYMRVERAGDDWTQSYSYDGVNWTVAVSFTHQMAVTKAGPFAANFDAGDGAPAHTAVIDYFFNLATPIVPEDGGPVPESEHELVVTVTGLGTVTADPDQEIYGCGDVLQLTAHPEVGWVFTGWGGDLSGSDNPAIITMDSDKTVTAAFALSDETYTEDFETYADGADPFDWFDTAADNSMEEDDSLFKVFDLSGNKAFGTTSTLTNIHSHYMGTGSDALSSYEYTGRMSMTLAGSGIGVTFLSQYPQQDAYYRLRRYTDNSFHISPHGTSITGGTTDTGVVPLPNVWYRFRIQVVDTGTRTEIKARVWQDGTAEPSVWQVDAYDDSATRLTSGTIGVWGFTSGSKYWDDLVVDSWSPPAEQYQLTASVTGGNGTVSPLSGNYYEGAVVTLTALPDPGYRVLAWSGTDNDALTTNTNTVTMDADKTVTVEFELIPVQYNLTASVTGGNGTVSPTSGAYDEGAVVTLTALPDPGYRVLAWSGTDNDALTTNTNTVTMIADKTVTVEFELIQYALTASVTGGNGTVSPTSGAYDEGAVVTLTALPDPGYRVLAWSGTDNDALTTNTNTVTMDADKTVTVEFELIPVQYNLTASVTGGNGTVSPTSGAYDEGAVVTLTALPDPGYRVLAWSGTDNDALTTNTNTVTMIADKTVTVEFELIQYALTASVTGGNGTVSPTSGAYDEGAVVTLTALPDPGYRVLAWSGTDNDALTTNTNTVTMDADKTVTVEFELIPVQYNLTASVTGGNGTVSPTSGAYDEGAVVTLTALPDPGYRVLAWSGTDNDALTTNTNTVTMNGDKNITVEFEPLPVPENIVLNPGFEDGKIPWKFYTNGEGSFTVSPPAYDGFEAACITTVTAGTNIQFYQYNLALEPNTDYRLSFAAYSNTGHDMAVSIFKHVQPYTNYGLLRSEVNLTTSWNIYTIDFTTRNFDSPINDARLMFWFADDATAGDQYRIDSVVLCKVGSSVQYNLSASVTGGNGTVSPTSGTYDEGTVVTLTASPDAGYRVAAWSGTDDDALTTNTNTVTMSTDKIVTVEFEPIIQYTLTMAVSGNGSTIPSVGDHTYAESEVVTVSALSYGGWQFDSWTGDVADPYSAITTVSMDTNKTVTATFTESDVIYSENFEVYASGADPFDWFDSAADNSMLEDDSLFKIFDLSDNKAFGTTSALANIHSHFMGAGIDTLSSLDYTGRMMITSTDSGIGVTFFSQYPQADAYYRLRRFYNNSFHIAPHGTSMTGGTTDTGVIPLPNVWYRFRILVVDTGTRTVIRAKVWQDGMAEPSVWQATAYDDSATRLTSGKIGVWSYTSGNKYWDDLTVDLWSPGVEPPFIDIWYGQDQTFGHIGIPQRWVNILGNVSDPDGVESLTYSLNDGPELPLTIGPTDRRLDEEGDFNVELAFADLEVWPNNNTVVLRALDIFGNEAFETVTVNYESGNVWPESYTINWSSVSSIQDVAQIVDGLWTLEADSIRPIKLGYDRLVAIGDFTWKSYEVTVPITVHAIEDFYDFPSNGPALGLIVRWQGHTADGEQPSEQWWPLGVFASYRWRETDQLLELADTYYNIADTSMQLDFEVQYIFKLRAETVSDSSLYSFKVWQAEEPEPSEWSLVHEEQGPLDQTQGSLLLVAHHVDASFGDVMIVPLDGSP